MPKINLDLDMSLLGFEDGLDGDSLERDWLDSDLVSEENEGEPIPLDDWEEIDDEFEDDEVDDIWSEMSYNRVNKDSIVYGEL